MTWRQVQARGGARPLRCTAVYLADGLPVCDLTDGVNVYTACRVLVGSGGPGTFVYAPPLAPTTPDVQTPDDADGSEVLGTDGDGRGAHPTAIGALHHAKARGRFVVLERPTDDNANYSDKNGLLDVVLENNGSRVLVSEFGHVLLDALISGAPVVVQVDPTSFLRIAQGDNAAERLLLAGPVRDYLDGLAEKINALQDQVETLTTAINTLGAGAVAVGATPQALAAKIEATLKVAPYASTDVDATADDLVASAVRISSLSLADE